VRRFSANKSKAKQATSRLKLIDKIKPEDIKPSSRQYPWIRFEYDEKEKLHRLACEIENLGFGYETKVPIIKSASRPASRPATGSPSSARTASARPPCCACWPANWAAGRRAARSSGRRRPRPGYFAQDHAADFADKTPLTEWIVLGARRRLRGRRRRNPDPRHPGPPAVLRRRAKKPVNVISGGEQGRMLFGKLMLLRNNVLLMDEPTNHLDMESIESLNTALEKLAPAR
jgi:ATPase subunit of ABC transporter with duplicated ATPase domains